MTYSNTASDGREQENLGTGSDLSFTGSNRQEKKSRLLKRKILQKAEFQKGGKQQSKILLQCSN